jgi:hypothetical protein
MRIQNTALQRPKLYKGLAFVSAATVRGQGWAVEDSRSEYLGHADILNGAPHATPGEAVDPAVKKAMRTRAKEIANKAKYVEDPRPGKIWWLGGE